MSPSPVYLIGSLRNPRVPEIAQVLRTTGLEVVDDWYAAGPEADDLWQRYEQARGRSYVEALQGLHAGHVFDFDKFHLDRCQGAVLVLPAGRSGHLEFGYVRGQGKWGLILLPEDDRELPRDWIWLTGIYEGEGSITRNGRQGGHGLQLTVTMGDEDIIRQLRVVSGVGSIEGPYTRDNPKWSPMWRWAVRRREDVLYVARGMYPQLGERRKAQIVSVLEAAGIRHTVLDGEPTPRVARFDVMYKFATGVYTQVEELLKVVKGLT